MALWLVRRGRGSLCGGSKPSRMRRRSREVEESKASCCELPIRPEAERRDCPRSGSLFSLPSDCPQLLKGEGKAWVEGIAHPEEAARLNQLRSQ